LTISPPTALKPAPDDHLGSVDSLISGLASVGYIASRRIATAVYMAVHLQKPILVEGSAGVGKTELALSTSALLGLPLIRMQCYEGLDESKALYEWKYGKQLLYTQILKDRMGEALADAPDMDAAMKRLHGVGDLFYSEEFLEPRPLMKALKEDDGCVLLIDEIDKSDEAFEAFLLEVLSAYQVSIPELGVLKAKTPPLVFLTSNNVRDLGDALKRRCLHLHIPLPDAALEQKIVASRVPGIEAKLTQELVGFALHLGDGRLGPRADPAERLQPRRRSGARHPQRVAEVRAGHRGGGPAGGRTDPQAPGLTPCRPPWRTSFGRCGRRM
jgi:MoxR-like ATPase